MMQIVVNVQEELYLTADDMGILILQLYNTLDEQLWDMNRFNALEKMVIDCTLIRDKTWEIRKSKVEGRKAPKKTRADSYYIKKADRI